MATPLTNKTTISSRNKMTHSNGGSQISDSAVDDSKTSEIVTQVKRKSNIQPPSQFNCDNAFRTPAPLTSSRLASLANGLPSIAKSTGSTAIRENGSKTTSKLFGMRPISSSTTSTIPSTVSKVSTAPTNGTKKTSSIIRLGPSTNIKVVRQRNPIPAMPSTCRVAGPRSRLLNNNNINNNHHNPPTSSLNSRSPSIVSTISSATATSKRPSVASASVQSSNQIPDTNSVRKGLAKFSNPIECQRQFSILNKKIKDLDECVKSRDDENHRLQEQLKHMVKLGVGYATVVQYLSRELKLGSNPNLVEECEQLKSRLRLLESNERKFESKLESIVNDYKDHLQVELELREAVKKELADTREAHTDELSRLNDAHNNQLHNLVTEHSELVDKLEKKIEVLESELQTKTKDLSDLRSEHEELSVSFSKLEDTLTKDKDARVKYAQEKISQLQKDVESLNSVLEMRLERIHLLEKDSLLLEEVKRELTLSQDANKALKQQVESLNAALEKKRRQFENLTAEHEKVSQELKRERKERRRMTMKTEELEYALNESCASDTSQVFNTSACEVEGSDHLVEVKR